MAANENNNNLNRLITRLQTLEPENLRKELIELEGSINNNENINNLYGKGAKNNKNKLIEAIKTSTERRKEQNRKRKQPFSIPKDQRIADVVVIYAHGTIASNKTFNLPNGTSFVNVSRVGTYCPLDETMDNYLFSFIRDNFNSNEDNYIFKDFHNSNELTERGTVFFQRMKDMLLIRRSSYVGDIVPTNHFKKNQICNDLYLDFSMERTGLVSKSSIAKINPRPSTKLDNVITHKENHDFNHRLKQNLNREGGIFLSDLIRLFQDRNIIFLVTSCRTIDKSVRDHMVIRSRSDDGLSHTNRQVFPGGSRSRKNKKTKTKTSRKPKTKTSRKPKTKTSRLLRTKKNKKYNKTIKKSRNKQYGGNNNTPREESIKITLDGITFELLEFKEDFASNRGLVKIKSTSSGRESFIFFVYRSLSELGFWRYALNMNPRSLPNISFWKGDEGSDYVQTTFIDLRLQQFINESLIRIKKSTKKINCTSENYIKLNNFYQKNEKGEYLYENITNNFKIKIEDNQKLYDILDSINSRSLTDINSEFHKSRFTYGECSKAPSKGEINVAANLLQDNYDIGSVDKIYDPYQFKVELVNNELLDLNNSVIYSVILNKKTSSSPSSLILKLLPNNLKLYYIHIIKLNIESTEFGNKTFEDYKIPVFLEILDDGSKILNTGLYPEFLTLGAYICKTLEYSRQCHFRDTTKCTSKYSFAGDLYKYGAKDGGPVFPFDQI
jgi:hypothetical protein